MTFNLCGYQEILQAAKEAGRTFRRFGDPSDGRSIFLRHDIDYSLQMAVDIASINHEENIEGTFFLLLRSDIYNLLSAPSQSHVERILDFGQGIGFHVAVPHGKSPTEILEWLPAEMDRFKDAVPSTQPVFAWHNTFPELLDATACHTQVAGWTNVYANPFFKEIGYRSDTNFRNSAADLRAAVEAPGPLQLLIHPCNWVAGGNDMRDVFAGIWPTVIRERESDFLFNRAYKELLPHGLPDDALVDIAQRWRAATE